MGNGQGDFLRGTDFYDSAEIFNDYMNKRRNRPATPNNTLEEPVIFELAGDLTDRKILDLGCGDGIFGLDLLGKGCKSYLGIDGSKNMIELAHKNIKDSTAKAELANIEDWGYPTEQFDLAVSRLVLHYIDDVSAVFRKVHQALVPNGQFVFSVEHPVITSSDKGWQGKGKRQDWLVDGYFHSGRRENSWLGGKVIKYHRTIEQYFSMLQQARFKVEALREATPVQQNFFTEEDFKRRQRIPLFLIMSGRKSE